VKTFGRFSSHRRFEDRRIFPAGSLNQAIVGPTLSSWFTSEYKKSGKKLDMGKGCVRFKSLEDLALNVVGRTVARVSAEEHMANYQAARALMGKEKSRAKKSAVKNHAAV
jgi:hypothetical protein